MRIKPKLNYSVLSAACFGVLSLFIVTMLCPNVHSDASAAEDQAADVPASAGSDTLYVGISNSQIEWITSPILNNGVLQSSINVSAKTENTKGYILEISAADMKSIDSSNSAKISSLSSAATLANFPDNRWGYYFGTTEATETTQFQPFSTTPVEVDAAGDPSSTLRTRKLTVAAKVGTSLPASTYTGKVIISAVSPTPAWSSSITNMQQMTSAVCNSLTIGAEKQLTDTRDSQTYWVGKMKDGRCWMLQNLALGSTNATTRLTATNSNVSTSWTLPKAYTLPTNEGTTEDGVIQLWNLGKWVLATPLLTEGCPDREEGLTGCVSYGFVDVSDGTKFKPTFEARAMPWEGANASSNTLVAVNCTAWSGTGNNKTCIAGTYDAHYLVGNYYSWMAATANTGASTLGGNDANGSICPKGWKLPTGSGSRDIANEFSILLDRYGVSSKPSGSSYNIAGSPLHFVRSGRIGPYKSLGNDVAGAGNGGRCWSSRAYDSISGDYDNFVYTLEFGSSGVYPFTNTSDSYGFSVRCINDPSI